MSPTLLLWTHLNHLRVTRLAPWAVALALLILPIGFLALTEFDRYDTRRLIEHVATPDYTTGCDTLPFSEARARRAAHTLYAYERAAPIPLLSLWRNFRLFDGLHPRQEVMNVLVARFGRPTPGLAAALFSHTTDRPQFAPSWQRPTPATKPATLTFRGLEGRKVTAHITLPEEIGTEFISPITLADGVWVTGLRLTLPQGGPWREATLRDRRAATWVYNQLTRQRIDPALLTLDTPTSGMLRVFPLEATTARQVEIDLLLPHAGWCAEPLRLGNADTPLRPLQAEEADPRREVSVCFLASGAQEPIPEGYDLYVLGGKTLCVQETPPSTLPEPWELPQPERALRFAQGYAYAHNLRLGAATFLGEGWSKVQSAYTPEPPRAPLPKLAPDDPWQLGAQMWQLAEAMHHNATHDVRADIRALAERCGVLTPTAAYIVVETDLQERALAVKDLATRHADWAFDLEPTDAPIPQDAPGFSLLIALFALLIALLKGVPLLNAKEYHWCKGLHRLR